MIVFIEPKLLISNLAILWDKFMLSGKSNGKCFRIKHQYLLLFIIKIIFFNRLSKYSRKFWTRREGMWIIETLEYTFIQILGSKLVKHSVIYDLWKSNTEHIYTNQYRTSSFFSPKSKQPTLLNNYSNIMTVSIYFLDYAYDHIHLGNVKKTYH
jgi:hypothetical protein